MGLINKNTVAPVQVFGMQGKNAWGVCQPEPIIDLEIQMASKNNPESEQGTHVKASKLEPYGP